jgi:hydrogenase maturation protein HypF
MFGGAVFAMEDLRAVREFDPGEREILRRALARGVNAPRTSSAGRLFDAVASLAGLRQVMQFEGQAAMELEWAADSPGAPVARREYPFPVEDRAGVLVADWEPLVRMVLDDVRDGVAVGPIAAGFHDALARLIAAVAARLKAPRVVLTGGCFQNRRLLELAVGALRGAGVRPYWHQRIPPNDGGIALGQAVAAGAFAAAAGGG